MTRHTILRAIPLLFLLTLVMGFAPHTVEAQTPDDLSRVLANGRIDFGVSADYPPFEYYNDNFLVDGFDIALAREMGKRLGVEVVFNDFAFAGLLDAVQLGQVDAAISAISVTPDRQQVVDFTNLYFIDDDAVLTLKSNPMTIHSATDFAGLRVGAERGTTYYYWAEQYLVETGIISPTSLLDYPDSNNLVRGLRAGEIDAALMSRLPAFVYNMSSQDLYPAGIGLNQQRYAIAAPKGSTLVAALNEALLEIQDDGTYAMLVDQYLKLNKDSVTNDTAQADVTNPPVETAPATPACIYGMAYVADLNLDDNNMTTPPIMAPNQAFVKSWRVRNSGTCEWEPDFALVYINGNRPEAIMGAQPVAVGRTVQPGATIDLAVSLVAPNTYGVFQAFFQMRDNTGKLFGEVIWAGIQVPNPNPPPTPIPPATQLNPNLRADSSWVYPGQCTTVRWDIDNVSAVYFIDGGNVQGVGGHDSRTVCPTTTTTYVLRVVATDGTTVDFPITINVNSAPPQQVGPSITRFTVDRNSIRVGECVRLDWSTQNASGVNLYRGDVRIASAGPVQGAQTDCPPAGQINYRLEAYGNGNVSQSLSVYVDAGRPRDE